MAQKLNEHMLRLRCIEMEMEMTMLKVETKLKKKSQGTQFVSLVANLPNQGWYSMENSMHNTYIYKKKNEIVK